VTAPLVAVTGPSRRGWLGFWGSWLALRRAGARVRRIRPPYREAQLEGVSAVVIGGGTHIEPTRYAQRHLEGYLYDRERDELEWRVIERAFASGLPLLGICRGAQVLNVFCGGSLFQDLVTDLPGVTLRSSYMAIKRIALEPDSQVASVMGVQSVWVNSLHRQGIDRLGAGVRVAARDAFGIVQAIELADNADQFVIGVQWHPEYLPVRPSHQRLFRSLVSAAKRASLGPSTSVKSTTALRSYAE
jgi:putative glutamine amidotransferase